MHDDPLIAFLDKELAILDAQIAAEASQAVLPTRATAKAFLPLQRAVRYKAAYGGRGSGKSNSSRERPLMLVSRNSQPALSVSVRYSASWRNRRSVSSRI